MNSELRIYTIQPGALDEWIAEWRDQIRPLRERFGFSVLGPWINRDGGKFVWILGHEDDWDAVDASYYGSPERKAMEPDPARHLVTVEHLRLEDA